MTKGGGTSSRIDWRKGVVEERDSRRMGSVAIT